MNVSQVHVCPGDKSLEAVELMELHGEEYNASSIFVACNIHVYDRL